MIAETKSEERNIYEQQVEQLGEFSGTIEEILGLVEAETVLGRVRSEWGEGNVKHITFGDSGYPDARYGGHPLGGMKVGLTLETAVPVVVGHYDREYLGERYHEPVECMPGHSHDSGYTSVYGEGSTLRGVERREELTNLDIIVRPEWSGNDWWGRNGKYAQPERYLVMVGNLHIPNDRQILTPDDILKMKSEDGELVRHYGTGGQVYRSEIEFGIKDRAQTIGIDAISPILRRRFDDAIEVALEERRVQKGNPKDFRVHTATLAEFLPNEFEDKGFVSGKQISQWAKRAISS